FRTDYGQDLGWHNQLETLRQAHETAVAEDVRLSLSIVGAGNLVGHPEFADQLFGPRFGPEPTLGSVLEDTALDVGGANQAAWRGVKNDRFYTSALQI